MSIPATKAELLAAIATTFGRLMTDLSTIPPERAREASLDGHAKGTVRSPADLVAYLIGWNETVSTWLERDDEGEAVYFPAPGFQWNQLGLLAQSFYAEHRGADWTWLLKRLVEAQTELTTSIMARSNDELYGKEWYRTWTKGRMIQLNTSSPYANASRRIRKWLKAQT